MMTDNEQLKEGDPIAITKRRHTKRGAMTNNMLDKDDGNRSPKSVKQKYYNDLQTPRRSARKSVKPKQDYLEIVEKRSLRSTSKKLEMPIIEEYGTKLTFASVGKVSETRKKRNKKVSTVANLLDLFEDYKKENINKDGNKEKATNNDSTANVKNTLNIQRNMINQPEINNAEKNTNQIKMTPSNDLESANNENKAINLDEVNKSGNSNTFDDQDKPKKLDETFEIKTTENASEDITVDVEMKEKPFKIMESYTLDNEMASLIYIDEDAETVEENEQLDISCKLVNINTITTTKQTLQESPSNIENKNKAMKQSSDKKHVRVITPRDRLVRKTKIVRTATPYRSGTKGPPKQDNGGVEKNKNLLETSNVTRRPRRRSLSTSALPDNNYKKIENNVNHVTFCSPANQIIIVENMDEKLEKKLQSKTSNTTDANSNIKSMDSGPVPSELAKPGQTPKKLQPTPQKVVSRTKLPNFAVIHQKQFEKMENLVEHVARKKERAKILTNSSTKIVSGKKKGKNQTKMSTNKENIKSKNKKVVKNIEEVYEKQFTYEETLTADELERIKRLPRPEIPLAKLTSNMQTAIKGKSKTDAAIVQAGKIQKPLKQKVTEAMKAKQEKQSHIQSKSIPQKQQNKSVTLLNKKDSNWMPPITSKVSSKLFEITTENKEQIRLNSTESALAVKSPKDKIAGRRQRHMDMFKGRGATNRTLTTNTSRTENFIRGVRLNRRFDLQMQHRQNLNN